MAASAPTNAPSLLAHTSNVAMGLLRVGGACKRERGDGGWKKAICGHRTSLRRPATASAAVSAGSRNCRWAPLFPTHQVFDGGPRTGDRLGDRGRSKPLCSQA